MRTRKLFGANCIIPSLALCFCLLCTEVRSEIFGAFPLSDSVVSAWVLDEGSDKGGNGVLVYFMGEPGWHQRSWESANEWPEGGDGTLTQRLEGGDITLEVSISQKTGDLAVQGTTFPSSEGNVFLVTGADKPSDQKIETLGTFPLNLTEGEPLSLTILRENAGVRERLGDGGEAE